MKKDYNSLDYVKQKFDSAFLETPDSLSESAIKEKLSNLLEQSAPKKAKRIPLKQIISIAACFILVITTLTSFNALNGKIPPVTGVKNGGTSSAVSAFNSYAELNRYFHSLKKYKFYYPSDLPIGCDFDGIGSGLIPKTSADQSSVLESNYAMTYKNYIFYVLGRELCIYRTDNDKIEKANTLTLGYDNDEGETVYIKDILIFENRLAVSIEKRTKKAVETDLLIYDISDPENPQEINRFTQSGFYYALSMSDGTIHLVTDFRAYKKSSIPYTINNAKKQKLDAEDIIYTDAFSNADFTVISSININDGKMTDSAKAILGNCAEIYFGSQNIYIANYSYDKDLFNKTSDYQHGFYEDRSEYSKTQIVKITATDGKIEATGFAETSGYITKCFSMAETNGIFKIITNSYVDNEIEKNTLYTFDETFNIINEYDIPCGAESIQAIRFKNNSTSIITFNDSFEKMYTVNTANPQNPEVTECFDIEGYINYFVDIDDNCFIGVGEGNIPTATGSMGSDIVRITTFDNSDKQHPIVSNTQIIEEYYSPASDDYKSLIINHEKKYFALSYYAHEYINDNVTIANGILTFRIENGKAEKIHNFNPDFNRDGFIYAKCISINDYVYLFDDFDNPKSFCVE